MTARFSLQFDVLAKPGQFPRRPGHWRGRRPRFEATRTGLAWYRRDWRRPGHQRVSPL